MLVLVCGRSKKSKTDKNNDLWIMTFCDLGCIYMADLKEVRSSDRTAEGGRFFHCTISKGKNEYLL